MPGLHGDTAWHAAYEPLAIGLHVGGVEVDDLALGHGRRALGVFPGPDGGQETEPLRDAVGGHHRVDLRPGADGDLAVGTVHGGLVRHPARPVAGRPGAEVRPHRAAARGDGLGEPGRAVADPARLRGRIVGQPAVGHLAERDGLGRLGGHDRGGPPVRPPDVRDELPQRPVRAGGHRGGEVSGGGDPGQRAGAAGHFGEEQVGGDHVSGIRRRRRSSPRRLRRGARRPHSAGSGPAAPPYPLRTPSTAVSPCRRAPAGTGPVRRPRPWAGCVRTSRRMRGSGTHTVAREKPTSHRCHGGEAARGWPPARSARSARRRRPPPDGWPPREPAGRG